MDFRFETHDRIEGFPGIHRKLQLKINDDHRASIFWNMDVCTHDEMFEVSWKQPDNLSVVWFDGISECFTSGKWKIKLKKDGVNQPQWKGFVHMHVMIGRYEGKTERIETRRRPEK